MKTTQSISIKLPTCEDVRQDLARHAAGFLTPDCFGPEVLPVGPGQIPEPWRMLLVHHQHMTAVLEAYYGSDLSLKVLDFQREGDRYSRKIALSDDGGAIVELGLVHLNLHFIPAAPREEILQRKSPLGSILIRHNVFRRIEPHRYLRLPVDWPGAAQLSVRFTESAYARLATIYCEDQPAVELFEIVGGGPVWI